MQRMRQPFPVWSEGAYATPQVARAVARRAGAAGGQYQVSRHGR